MDATLPALASIVAATVALVAAVLARRLAPAPGWREQSWFALAATAAAGFALLSAGNNAGWPDPTLVGASRVQLALVSIQALAWHHYADGALARPVGPLGRRARRWGHLAAALLALVPGLAYRGEVHHRLVRLAGQAYDYRSATPTPLGGVLFSLLAASTIWVTARFALGWRRGAPYAGWHALALAALVLLGVGDALAVLRLHGGPFLLDLAFLVPVVALAAVLLARVQADARDLVALRTRLEGLVQERTRDLLEARDALRGHERLAALGQFATGVAHEVNNPASVVTSSLAFLDGHLPPGDLDAREALREGRAAMARINGLVRRLVDAGRMVETAPAGGAAPLAEGLRQAVMEARPRFASGIAWEVEAAGDALVALPASDLRALLAALLANAAEALPGGRGGVRVRLLDGGGEFLVVEVDDDGRGLTAEEAFRAFDPFFTTKPAGQGAGLGLPMARALASKHGGALSLAPRPDGGARATLSLPRSLEAAPA